MSENDPTEFNLYMSVFEMTFVNAILYLLNYI